MYVPPTQFEHAKKIIELFKKLEKFYETMGEKIEEDIEEDEDKKKKIPNMLDFLFYFEQTGIGLPRRELVLLNLSIRELMAENPIENVRFWGKILGIPKNYYVVEADLQPEELNLRIENEREQKHILNLVHASAENG